MQLESGFEKIRIGKAGYNQDKVNRFLRWVEQQGFIIWNDENERYYEIDGISKASQQTIQRYLEGLGRVFKKRSQAPLAIMCYGYGKECFNESSYGSLYCTSCTQKKQAYENARRQAAFRANPCLHRGGCHNAARHNSPFCFNHRDDRRIDISW